MKRFNKDNLIRIISIMIGAMLILASIYFYKQNNIKVLTYSDFIEKLNQDKVEKVEIDKGPNIKIKLKGSDLRYISDNPRKEDFKEELLLKNVEVSESNRSSAQTIEGLISLIIIGSVFYIVYKKSKKIKTGDSIGFETKSVNKEILGKFNFSNVAGNVEAKEQVQDIIDFIKDPQKYEKYGARMPRGMIFYGEPGTGKTLMAKAIAGEAGVEFFSVSGSDFVQLYVGVGASRVRQLFESARKCQKAVIFIDEIDAIGKKRSNSQSGSSDEKDQTLNALLTQMSGFNDHEGIVVIGATNRLDVLDPALLRPGRFDRHIEIGLPDLDGRKKILNLHMKNKPISNLVDLDKLARQTVYFSGAMLENLLNEAAIYSAKKNKGVIEPDDIDKAFYTIVAGDEKKDKSSITAMDRKITAYHEAGHTLITRLVCPSNTISKVSIIPSTKGAGGFSMSIPQDRMFHTKKDMENQIKVSLAGRAAEEIIFGDDNITTGASNDIEKATKIVRDYCMRYGMNSEVGLVNLQVLLEGESSDYTSEIILHEATKIMKKLYNDTKSLILANKHLLDYIADELLEKETLDEDDIEIIFCNNPKIVI